MKIVFEDSSYLEFSVHENKEVTIALCGLRDKDKTKLTISAARLTEEEVKQVLNFFKQFE